MTHEATTLEFLSVEVVLALHQRQLDRFGGSPGIRDLALLESAVAQPQSSIGDAYLHQGLPEMAGAYLFHIVSNHPFIDGNKRTGLLAALVFLSLNGVELVDASPVLHDLTVGVAAGELDKPAVTAALKQLVHAAS